jgi:hypothetical protein
MSNNTYSKPMAFMKLMLASFEHTSASEENAREYLIEEGLNPDSILQEGLARIKALQIRLKEELEPGYVKVESAATAKQTAKKSWFHRSVRRFIEESGNPDPIDEMRKRIRELVVRAFESGWEGPPFNPIQFAKFLGIEVMPNDSLIDARIVPQGNCYHIQYNPFQPPTRINFSVSHEIAHTIFSDCAESVRYREEKPLENRELEQLCNIDGLIELAKKYKASLEAIFLRYTEVIDIPCLVMIGIFKDETTVVVDYFKSSKFTDVRIPQDFVIPEGSLVYDCVAPGNTSRETVNWDFLKEPFEISSVGISPYKRDSKPRVGILMFPKRHVNTSPEQRKIILETGDATQPGGKGKKIIAQVVNTGASLGRGFGYSIAKKYPIVNQALQNWKKDKERFVLGETNLIELSPSLYVFQMLAQKGIIPKGDEVLIKYHELRKGLIELRETASRLNCSVHMPMIGAGNARGDWNIIIGMIHDELVNYNIKVHIYFLKAQPYNPNHKSGLTFYKVNEKWEKGKLF